MGKVGEVGMGLTERHWSEDEEPELTEQQLEDVISIQDRFYRRGYYKGYSDRDKEIVRCKDCKYGRETCGNIECHKPSHYEYETELHPYEWYCADGDYKE